MNMLREPNSLLVTIGATVGASTEIDMARFAGGSFVLPAASGTTEVTVYSQVGSEAYGIAKDDDNADIVMSVTAGQPRPLHPNVYNYPRIKLVASAGTATADVPMFLKS